MNPNHTEPETIVLGGGCFWCLEALYQRLKGVLSVTSGYAGGTLPNPDYESVCRGDSGHAEVVAVGFDPNLVRLEDLIDFFWMAHDPTTLNRQGADVGTQYRSIILFRDEHQETVARQSLVAAQGNFSDPIVTEIVPLGHFHSAEPWHQDYFRRNPDAAYCRYVISPKLQKLNPSNPE